MLTKELLMHVEVVLRNAGESFHPLTVSGPVSGGSIHQAFRISTPSAGYFIKCCNASAFPGIFETEYGGLETLRKTDTVKIPRVIAAGEAGGTSFLLMEYLEPGRRRKDYFAQLGTELAALHRNTTGLFGLDHQNYIGSLPQINRQQVNGAEFIEHMRFRPLVEMAYSKGLLQPDHLKSFVALYRILPDLLPAEPPALLHGDLWNGNVICGNDGAAWVIDPSVYYGYRETDLAMAKLFGGFDDSFYEAYNESFPLQPGWEERTGLFQLYPLLVHLNLFGRSYLPGIESVLNQYR